MVKNHKPFFIKIDIDRDESIENRPVFAHFRPVKSWSRDRPSLKLGLRKPFLSTHIVYKFQL